MPCLSSCRGGPPPREAAACAAVRRPPSGRPSVGEEGVRPARFTEPQICLLIPVQFAGGGAIGASSWRPFAAGGCGLRFFEP